MFEKANLVLASAGEGYGHGPWTGDISAWHWSMMGSHGLLGLLLVALLVALIVIALVYLVRSVVRGPAASETPSSARATLDARYARGEIERDDYQQRKQDLV